MFKKILLLLFTLIGIAQQNIAQNFYDLSTIQDVQLTFAYAN